MTARDWMDDACHEDNCYGEQRNGAPILGSDGNITQPYESMAHALGRAVHPHSRRAEVGKHIIVAINAGCSGSRDEYIRRHKFAGSTAPCSR